MSDEPTDETISLSRSELAQRLREQACPAGQPWTGDDPSSDHGHTLCWLLHMAADSIDEMELEIDFLYDEIRHNLGG